MVANHPAMVRCAGVAAYHPDAMAKRLPHQTIIAHQKAIIACIYIKEKASDAVNTEAFFVFCHLQAHKLS